jgi:hypothetical protein
VHDELEAEQLEAGLLAGEATARHSVEAAVQASLPIDPAPEREG